MITITSKINFLKSFSYQFSNEFYTSSILRWFSQYSFTILLTHYRQHEDSVGFRSLVIHCHFKRISLLANILRYKILYSGSLWTHFIVKKDIIFLLLMGTQKQTMNLSVLVSNNANKESRFRQLREMFSRKQGDCTSVLGCGTTGWRVRNEERNAIETFLLSYARIRRYFRAYHDRDLTPGICFREKMLLLCTWDSFLARVCRSTFYQYPSSNNAHPEGIEFKFNRGRWNSSQRQEHRRRNPNGVTLFY